MNNRLPSNAGVGVASILLIVIMLCMTVFASLSLLTAKNDGMLTDKTVSYTRAYYAADAEAQRTIAEINEAFAANTALPSGVEQSGDTVSFSVFVTDTTALYVTLRQTDSAACVITSYGVKPIETQTMEEETLHLWQ